MMHRLLSQQQFFSSSTIAMSNWHRPPHLHSASSWTSTASSISRSLSSDSEYSGSKLYGSTPKSIVQVLENTCVSMWVCEGRAPEIDHRNVVCSFPLYVARSIAQCKNACGWRSADDVTGIANMAAAIGTHLAVFDLFWTVNKVVFVGKHGLH